MRFNSAGRITRIAMPVSIVARSICQPGIAQPLRQRVISKDRSEFDAENASCAEVLPVRVFNPQGNNVFIAQVMLILQIVKSNHQPVEMPGAP